jgi:hypothetical protein
MGSIYPTKFASSTQKHKKVTETANQLIEIKKSQIKMFSTSKVKRRQRRNLQAQPKILKKIIETPNLPTRTKIFQKKKLCFVP